MRSSLASLMTDRSTSSTNGGTKRGCDAAGGAAADFRVEIAAASRVFADGLAAMWAARPALGTPDRDALLASITSRADGLAARATATVERPGAAGGFAQAAVSIRDLAARRIRAAEALTPRFAGLRVSRAELSSRTL